MSRSRELSRSIGSTIGAQVATTVFSIVFLGYFGRVLPKEEIALYALIVTVSSWVQLISGLGLSSLTVREVPGLLAEGRREDACRLISSTMLYCSVGGAVVAVAMFWLAPVLARGLHGSLEYADEFRIIAVIAVAQNVTARFGLMQRALQRFHVSAVCHVLEGTGGRVAALAAYPVFGLHGFLWAFALTSVLVAGMYTWRTRRELSLRFVPLGTMLRRSRAYIAVDALRNLLMNLDRPAVGFILGDVALADYFVAKRIYDLLTRTSQAVIGPPGVKVSEVKVEGLASLNAYVRKSLCLVTFLFIPAGFVLMGAGDSMLRLIVGNKYATGGIILACFGVAVMAQSVSQMWRELVFRLASPRYLAVFTILLSAVTLPTYLVLLPPVGPVGIPIAYVLAHVVASTYATIVLRRDVGLTIPLSIYGRALLCGLVVLAGLLPARMLGESVLGYLAMAGAVVGSYGLGFVLFAPAQMRNLARRVATRVPGLRSFAMIGVGPEGGA